MTPNKYIKHWGIDRAKREVALIGTIAVITSDKDWLSELNRLVESHRIVESYDGIDKARDFISPYSGEQLNKKIYSPMLRTKQAIADVESCQ